jgi:hypothetical protein
MQPHPLTLAKEKSMNRKERRAEAKQVHQQNINSNTIDLVNKYLNSA